MGVKIAAHTMEYQGGRIVSHLQLRNYSALDYKEYKSLFKIWRNARQARIFSLGKAI